MIHTAKQLKDKVKNMSGGNSEVAQALIRTYFMERFLERVSVSEYRNNFILKGGMLVASIVGVDMRATMDIDTTVKALPLNEKNARAIIERIGELQLEDGVKFKITLVKEIMEEFNYPGIRMMIEANLERMRQPFKIDISTDDAITPGAVEYKYKLMFENRSISVLSYNLETLLAEKMQTILAKDIKKPFKLEGITRVDDTPVHKAVREALVNCLVNTDYFLPCGVVIKKEDDKLVIENPGSIRTGKKQMLRGGISDPRNKTLMKMFNMIGIGERAGSGIPDIYQVWENEGWPMPVVEESYNPDRTRLSLEFAKKQTIKTSEEEKEPKRSQKGAEKEPIKGAERKKEILKLIKVNSTITQVEIMKELDLTRKQVQKDMKELQEMHIIAREGTNRRGRWIIVKENR